MRARPMLTLFACAVFAGLTARADAQSTSDAPVAEYTPHALEDFPMELLWGDTHVHSAFSMDANSTGNTLLTPAEAYRYAKGEPVKAMSGMTARLDQPLDFLVVSDHAEYMGLLPKLREGDPMVLADPQGRALAEGLNDPSDGGMKAVGALVRSLMTGAEPLIDNGALKRGIWNDITRLADEANDPGRFSALIGFEWSSMPAGDNLHRVVVYADGADKAAAMIPLSAFDSDRPEDLWTFMERYERQTGGRILAIPHNANMSNGRMFALQDSDGQPFSAAYAARRAAHEPIVEVTQIKGDGETHPDLSPRDPFADFETWDFGNIDVIKTVPKGPGQVEFEYARSALKLGLEQTERTGANPFKFGMIGSSDSHTGLATAAEDDYWGKLSTFEPLRRAAAARMPPPDAPADVDIGMWIFAASGYAAAWATENTRDAVFDAMRRREVYATTGSRIAVRFFGGWSYTAEDALRPDVARIGYRKGVPMGGDLPLRFGGSGNPRFIATALKDPRGANLDRIQIVKGWRAADGSLHEEVHDVALSDGRRSVFGRVRPLRSTVDEATARYTNDIGDAQLVAYWEDEAFDPAQRAFYYARVIEIPTPRWNVYDAVRLGAPVPAGVPTQVQDRAYTSPIWYTP